MSDIVPRDRWRRMLRSTLSVSAAVFITLVAMEGLARVGAFLAHGGSRYHLFYGLHAVMGGVGISPWWVFQGGYYKFPPHYVLTDAAGQGKEETASINSLGFRGPDFEARKPPRTFRVIALGESSTFGFHNTDTGTYPYQLEQLFRRQEGSLRVEVVNAGFPYYTSGSIRALLEQELGDYEPDVITLYSGYNDCGWPLHLGAGLRALIWVQQHSAIYLVLKENVITDARVYKVMFKLARWLNQRPDTARLAQQTEDKAARYRNNVNAIVQFAQQRGIPLVAIRQPITAYSELRKDPEVALLSYEGEYEAIRKKFDEGVFLSSFELSVLVHHRLVQELDTIVRDKRLPVVDNIALVDEDRRRLRTWVHLTEEANGILAEALYRVIEPFVPRVDRLAGSTPATR